MPITLPHVGQHVRATRDLLLVGNAHAVRLTHGPATLPKGTEAEIEEITTEHMVLNCKDGPGQGASAWGLRIRIARVIFGTTFA